MPFTNDAKNPMLDDLASRASHLAAHIAYSPTGGNEATGGDPAYARLAASWSAASGGLLSLSATVTFDLPAGTYRWAGLWTALSLGTHLGMAPLGATPADLAAFTANATTDTLTAPGHGFVNDDTVTVLPGASVSTPGGLTVGDVYFVVGASGDTLQLSLTQGGAAIDITAAGGGILAPIKPVTLSEQGQLRVDSLAIPLDG